MSKTWRCFLCDEVFRSRKTAQAHFGADMPACVDPLRADEKARLIELREAQDYALLCQEHSNRAEDVACELDEFKRLTGCDGTGALRMKMADQSGNPQGTCGL